MFKSRRTAVRRLKENRQFGGRGTEKRHKLEGNSNIMSNRVTIPPRFFSLAVKSEAVHRSPLRENFNCGSNFILTEDLHGPFSNNLNENHKRPRRSLRISKKTEDTRSYDSLTAFEYYCKDLKRQKSNQEREEPQGSSRKHNCIVRHNSKSLFREINDRCAKAETKTSLNFNYPISAVIEPQSKVEYFRPGVFCRNLSREVCVDLKQTDYLLEAKLAIAEKFRDIKERLVGRMNPGSSTPERGARMEANTQGEGFNRVPECDWIFKTPPRQRVVLPKAEECAIQPAVICTARKRSNIYELNPKFTVDLTGYLNRQNVEVDGRYMRHLASFDEKTRPGLSFGAGRYEGSDQADLADGGCSFFEDRNVGKEFTYSNPRSAVSELFAHVTARPAKTVKKASRTRGFYAGGSEGDLDATPTGANLFQSIEEFERDFTFVEDNGRYKIVSSQGSEGHGDRYEFKFRKNLFKEGDGKIFNFAEPNLFDFGKIKDN